MTTKLKDWTETRKGDIINVRTWMPRRADLRNYEVVDKTLGKGYEGLIIRKAPGFGGTTATMHIPANTIKNIELVMTLEEWKKKKGIYW